MSQARIMTLMSIVVPIVLAAGLFRWALVGGPIRLWTAWFVFSCALIGILAIEHSTAKASDWPLWSSAVVVALVAFGMALAVRPIAGLPLGIPAQILLSVLLGVALYFVVVVLLAAVAPNYFWI